MGETPPHQIVWMLCFHEIWVELLAKFLTSSLQCLVDTKCLEFLNNSKSLNGINCTLKNKQGWHPSWMQPSTMMNELFVKGVCILAIVTHKMKIKFYELMSSPALAERLRDNAFILIQADARCSMPLQGNAPRISLLQIVITKLPDVGYMINNLVSFSISLSSRVKFSFPSPDAGVMLDQSRNSMYSIGQATVDASVLACLQITIQISQLIFSLVEHFFLRLWSRFLLTSRVQSTSVLRLIHSQQSWKTLMLPLFYQDLATHPKERKPSNKTFQVDYVCLPWRRLIFKLVVSLSLVCQGFAGKFDMNTSSQMQFY